MLDLFDLMKQNPIDVDFSPADYDRLINHFRNNELNQFYMIVILKALTKREGFDNSEELITYLTASLADKVGKTSTPTDTDEQITSLADTLYKVLMLIDIKQIYNNRF